MAAFFQSWIFWFLLVLLVIHLICRSSLKKDEAQLKQKEILWQGGIYGVDLTVNQREIGAPLFKCCIENYNQAFEILFSDGETTLNINGIEYNYRRDIRAFSLYEKITNSKFALSTIHDVYILMYCILVVNNPGITLRIDEFLDCIHENEKEEKKSTKTKKTRRHYMPENITGKIINEPQN